MLVKEESDKVENIVRNNYLYVFLIILIENVISILFFFYILVECFFVNYDFNLYRKFFNVYYIFLFYLIYDIMLLVK